MKKVLLLISILLLQACGKPTMLKINHDDTANYNGPLKEITSVSFSKAILKDRRSNKSRIGAKKNGYGGDVGDIITESPVVEIVANAISTGFLKNGHTVIDDGRIKIEGSVTHFWFEMDMNFFTVEFIGDVQCNLSFVDTQTGQEIYNSDYSGHFADKKAGGAKKTWQIVMNKAVNNLIEDLVFDEDLKEALDGL